MTDQLGNITSQRILYEQAAYPVFQNRMYHSRQEAIECPTGEIRLVEDEVTGLVYNAAFKPECMVYDRNYQNEQGVSAAFRTHLEEVASIVQASLGNASLVEVGCGKGFFLEMLRTRGCDLTGFDPTYEGDSPHISRRLFDAQLGMQANGLILRHVLEHIQDPYLFLTAMKEANQGKGLVYIEVPCFDWICRNNAWFDVFYEHVNYFRPSDFTRLFGHVLQNGHLFGGQYQYVIADLATLRRPELDPADRAWFPSGFVSGLLGLPEEKNGFVVWGGSSKGVVFSLLVQRMGRSVRHVVDINPAKQGLFLPATGLRVSSPEEVLPGLESNATIYVMNSNYLDEVRAQVHGRFRTVAIDAVGTPSKIDDIA